MAESLYKEALHKNIYRLNWLSEYQYHSVSWVLLSELLEYDYSQTFIGKSSNNEITVKDYFGDGFMEILKDTLNHYPGVSPQHIRLFFLFR
jgi:hypothetical protein